MFDIDHFNQVNDTYGHAAGDNVLRELAARAKKSLRSGDLVARVGGGGEFVVMHETDLFIGGSLAEALRVTVANEPFIVGAVTISVGVTAIGGIGDDRDRVLK